MTPIQKELVQASFAQVLPIAETAAALFYGRLFELAPELRPLFKGDLPEQGLGAGFTPEVKSAWAATYTLLAAAMQTPAQTASAPARRLDQVKHSIGFAQ